MTPEQQMEQFSLAYVRAVAATAGVNVDRPDVDMDSVDIRFSVASVKGELTPPLIEAQLKCTTRAAGRGRSIRFALSVKNYNELLGQRLLPRILIVVVVPKNPRQWLDQDEQALALHHCGYWVSLAAEPETDHTTSVTVDVPRAQVFSVAALQRLLGKETAR